MSVMIFDDLIALGRPKGGLAILRKKACISFVRFNGSSLNGRIMAVTFKWKSTNTCVLNIEYSVELMECVAFIKLVIDQKKDVGGLEFCIIWGFQYWYRKDL